MHLLSLLDAFLNYLLMFVMHLYFELYNDITLNENEIVTIFKGVDKIIGELNIKMVN